MLQLVESQTLRIPRAAPASVGSATARAVRRHALGWLVAANMVGVGLSLLLLWPDAGRILGPLTYGRWVPLHLDWQLYGWCALPLVGALLRFFGAGTHDVRGARLALAAWSLALAVGGASWLAGRTSGKLFLDWAGAPGWTFVAALALLWLALAAAFARAVRRQAIRGPALASRGLLLAVLAGVPALLAWSSSRSVYPAVNPHSGGATGASLLGSTLLVVALFGLLPRLLGVGPRAGAGKATGWFWIAFAGSASVWLLLDHGNASHHAAPQIAGLATLGLWVPGLWHYARGWSWNDSSRPWLSAAGVWWALLVAQGLVFFLPGISERLKFTHALVAHGHLAMAGLLSAVNLVILHELEPRAPANPRWSFWAWQAGTALHVGALMLLGWHEGEEAGAVFRSAGVVQLAYVVRSLAGLAMLAASAAWLRAAWRRASPIPT